MNPPTAANNVQQSAFRKLISPWRDITDPREELWESWQTPFSNFELPTTSENHTNITTTEVGSYLSLGDKDVLLHFIPTQEKRPRELEKTFMKLYNWETTRIVLPHNAQDTAYGALDPDTSPIQFFNPRRHRYGCRIRTVLNYLPHNRSISLALTTTVARSRSPKAAGRCLTTTSSPRNQPHWKPAS